MEDKTGRDDAQALRERAKRIIAESKAMQNLFARAITVASDLDGGWRDCPRRRCRRARRCMAYADGEKACVPLFSAAAIRAAEAIVMFRARELFAMIRGWGPAAF